MDVGNASMCATRPIFFNTSKAPRYIVANFGQLVNFSELILDLNLKKTFSPNLNSLCVLILSSNRFFLSCATFKFCLIFTSCSSISLNNYGPIMDLSVAFSSIQFFQLDHLQLFLIPIMLSKLN